MFISSLVLSLVIIPHKNLFFFTIFFWEWNCFCNLCSSSNWFFIILLYLSLIFILYFNSPTSMILRLDGLLGIVDFKISFLIIEINIFSDNWIGRSKHISYRCIIWVILLYFWRILLFHVTFKSLQINLVISITDYF